MKNVKSANAFTVERGVWKFVQWTALLLVAFIILNLLLASGRIIMGPVREAATLSFQVPRYLARALILSEDHLFFEHKGFNFREIRESINLNLRKGAFVRGGSTITMQVAKLLYLTNEKTLSRKLQQAFITVYLEAHYSKEQILKLYLALADFGNNQRGILAASNYYFNKTPADLDHEQAARLVASLPNPKLYDPGKTKQRSRRRVERAFRFEQIYVNALERQLNKLGFVVDPRAEQEG